MDSARPPGVGLHTVPPADPGLRTQLLAAEHVAVEVHNSIGRALISASADPSAVASSLGSIADSVDALDDAIDARLRFSAVYPARVPRELPPGAWIRHTG
jgi:hypothetical protein